jgi:hypothetical protein
MQRANALSQVNDSGAYCPHRSKDNWISTYECMFTRYGLNNIKRGWKAPNQRRRKTRCGHELGVLYSIPPATMKPQRLHSSSAAKLGVKSPSDSTALESTSQPSIALFQPEVKGALNNVQGCKGKHQAVDKDNRGHYWSPRRSA